jgi:hypothetical protein
MHAMRYRSVLLLTSIVGALNLSKLVWAGWLLAGVGTAIHGLTAEKLTFRRLGWLPGQESEQFKPEWYHRGFVVLVGVIIAVFAFCSLLGIRWKH